MASVFEQGSAKKPYEPPNVTIYGAVHHITKQNRLGGQPDSASTPQDPKFTRSV